MAAQIHNFRILSHLIYFSFQSLCGALGDASRSTWCSAKHSLGISALRYSELSCHGWVGNKEVVATRCAMKCRKILIHSKYKNDLNLTFIFTFTPCLWTSGNQQTLSHVHISQWSASSKHNFIQRICAAYRFLLNKRHPWRNWRRWQTRSMKECCMEKSFGRFETQRMSRL